MHQWIPQNYLFSLYFTFWLERQITNRILKMMINKMENKQAKKLKAKERTCGCSLSHVRLFVTPWAAACQAPLSFTISWSLLKFMPTGSKEKEIDIANLNRIEHKQTWRWWVWVEWRKGEVSLLNQAFWRERKANAKAWRQECAWCTLGTGRRLLELI